MNLNLQCCLQCLRDVGQSKYHKVFKVLFAQGYIIPPVKGTNSMGKIDFRLTERKRNVKAEVLT